jgi:hypothetical protein
MLKSNAERYGRRHKKKLGSAVAMKNVFLTNTKKEKRNSVL